MGAALFFDFISVATGGRDVEFEKVAKVVGGEMVGNLVGLN